MKKTMKKGMIKSLKLESATAACFDTTGKAGDPDNCSKAPLRT